MRTARFVSVLLLLDGCAASLSSGTGLDPRAVQPERPSVATHAGTVAPGYVEIETGFETDRNADNTHAVQIPTVVKIGIAPRAQLSIVAPVVRATGIPLGAGDAGVGIKWRLTEDSPVLGRIAIQPSITWPTGGERGAGTDGAGLLLIDSRSIGPLSLDLNVGLTRHGNGADVPRTSTVWTVSSAIPIAGSVGWQLECFGYPGTHGAGGNAPIVAILAGPTLGAWRSLAFDTGVIFPLTGPQPKAWYAGVVANLGSLPR